MSGFEAHIGDFALIPNADGKEFTLDRDVEFKHGDFSITVPKGATNDFASIPGIGRIFLPKWGKYGWAAILHDFLYRQGWKYGVTRKQADRHFLTFMKLRNTNICHIALIYPAVRLFGWIAYQKGPQ